MLSAELEIALLARRKAMIPGSIIDYLEKNKVPFKRRPHAQVIGAQELAASLHVTGYSVAKSVIVEADGEKWIAVLPASETVSLQRLAELLNARNVRLLSEAEFAPLFRDCELGAEPPFGRLYGLPVAMDSSFAHAAGIVLRAGSHRESLEIAYADFLSLEKPRIGSFGVLPGFSAAAREREARTR